MKKLLINGTCNICNTEYSWRHKYCKNEKCNDIAYFKSIGYLDSEIERKCEEAEKHRELLKKYPKVKSNNKTHKTYWTDRGYTLNDATNIIQKLFKKSTIQYWIDRGYNEKTSQNLCQEYKNSLTLKVDNFINRGFTEEEAKNEIGRRRNIFSDNGKKIANKKNNVLCIEYYIERGHTKQYAINQIKQEQRNRFGHLTSNDYSEISIKNNKALRKDKYKYEKYIEKLSKTNKNNIYKSPVFKEYWIEKGYSLKESKHKAYITKFGNGNTNNHRASKIEIKCIDELSKYLGIKIERGVYRYIDGSYFCYDGKILNFIIEFNGTNFHMDERFYNKNDKNPVGVSFDDVKNKDQNKIDKTLTKYNFIEIWEYDYLNNKTELFKQIKNIIENKNENNKKRKFWSSTSI